MLTVRCTAKLLRRLRVSPEPSSESSTTQLGEWYATILPIRPAHLILLVNESTRLAAVLPAREIATLAKRIPGAIAEVLCELGVSDDAIAMELWAMAEVRFDRTASRSVLGTMNDYVFLMQWSAARQPPRDLLGLAKDLNHTPAGPLKYERPDDAARRRLGIAGEVARGKSTG
jgi:hypothetical protein